MAYRIRELIRIKNSVQKELHALEAQRSEMQRQVRKQIIKPESSFDETLNLGMCISFKNEELYFISSR